MENIFHTVNKHLHNPKLIHERLFLLREIQSFILSARWANYSSQGEEVFFILQNGISDASIKLGIRPCDIEEVLLVASKSIYNIIGKDTLTTIIRGNHTDLQEVKTRLYFLNHPITSAEFIMPEAFPLNQINYTGTVYRLEECTREINYISHYLRNVIVKERASMHWDRFSFLIYLLDSQNFKYFDLKLKLLNKMTAKGS